LNIKALPTVGAVPAPALALPFPAEYAHNNAYNGYGKPPENNIIQYTHAAPANLPS